MLGPIMVHMTALTEGREVRVGVVGGVMIPVSGRQYNASCTDNAELFDRWQSLKPSPLSIAPCTEAGIPPAPVAKMVDGLPVWPAAALT